MSTVKLLNYSAAQQRRSSRIDNQKQGHFTLFRSLLSRDWAKDTTKLAMWVRLIGEASYKPRRVEFSGKEWKLLPGELVTTAAIMGRKLRDQDGNVKSPQAVTRMINFFAREGMITTKGTRFGTVIRITNYADYQVILSDEPSEESTDNYKPSYSKVPDGVPDEPAEEPTGEQNKKDLEQELNHNPPIPPQGSVSNLAQECVDYYNKLTDSKCFSTAPYEKALNTVKTKGVCYTTEEVKLVTLWAVTVWKHKPSINNLCRMTRFDGYLSDALKWQEGADRNPLVCPHEQLISIWNDKFPERTVEFHEWNKSRPAYQRLERIWNAKTNQGAWREVKHIETLFTLIRKSTISDGIQEKFWFTLDWILDNRNWAKVYEQARREYQNSRQGVTS